MPMGLAPPAVRRIQRNYSLLLGVRVIWQIKGSPFIVTNRTTFQDKEFLIFCVSKLIGFMKKVLDSLLRFSYSKSLDKSESIMNLDLLFGNESFVTVVWFWCGWNVLCW
jgi:hypothetical protein